jgi:predicted RNA-binding protein with PUA domain
MIVPYAPPLPVDWYCDQCHVAVYERRCPHCGKTKRERQ